MTEFWLVKRARHVFTESSRVLEFESVCRQEKNDEDQVLKQIATLMNQVFQILFVPKSFLYYRVTNHAGAILNAVVLN